MSDITVSTPDGRSETLLLRDLLAAFVVAGVMAKQVPRCRWEYEGHAESAYRMADALLAARGATLTYTPEGVAVPFRPTP